MSPRSRSRLFPLFLTLTLLLTAFATRSARAQGEIPTLELNVPVERDLSVGESHDYQFKLQAGQFLRLGWSEQKFGLVMTILGPDGKPLVIVNRGDR